MLPGRPHFIPVSIANAETEGSDPGVFLSLEKNYRQKFKHQPDSFFNAPCRFRTGVHDHGSQRVSRCGIGAPDTVCIGFQFAEQF